MEPTGRFRIHRIVVGVLVGLAVLTLGSYGWVQYQSVQYRHRADALVARYKSAYEFCLRAGAVPSVCATQTVTACTRDAFWTRHGFVVDLISDDPGVRCRDVS